MLPTARKLAFNDVPVIDLAPAWSGDPKARAELAERIAEVCGRVGFIYIKNHRIATADIEAIFRTAVEFHSCRSRPRCNPRSPRTITRRATCTA